MRKQLVRKVLSGLLTTALMLSTVVLPGSTSYGASTPKDVKGHWAQKSIEKAIDAGIVAGYKDGSFRPENPVTRAEFCHMLNAVLGNTATAQINFKDVAQKDWFYSDVSKASAAGYTSGYTNGTFLPNNNISRQEAAIMVSQVVPTYGSAANLTAYPDFNKIADWAKPAMARMVGKGYINVYTTDKKLHPTDKMTRAQAATIVATMMEKETIVKTATTLNANGTQLNNSIYANGVTIPNTSASGKAELNKCVVMGTLSILGGDTVTLTNSRVAQATVQSASGVTLIANGETYVKNASVANTASLQTSSLSGDATFGPGFVNVSAVKNAQLSLNGNFPKVSMDGSSSAVKLLSGKIDSLAVATGGTGLDFTVESGATTTLVTASSPVYLHGSGTVTRLMANVSGITYETNPTTIVTATGAKAPVQSDARNTITPNPTNGKTNVNIDSTLTLTFDSAMKLYDGGTITDSDVKNIVELRRDSSSGAKISFTGSVDSAKKVLKIEPDRLLSTETKYYLIINKSQVKDSSGTANTAFVSDFTTGKNTGGSSVSPYLTFTPKDGGKGADLNVKPQILFTEAMLCYDGSSIKNADLEDILIFRENSSSGRKVGFDAAISSDKMTITIQPEDELDEDTKYYLAVDSNMLKTALRGTTVPGAAVTWTTGDGSDSSSSASDYMTFTPKNNKTGIAVDVEAEIRFDEAMECYDGETLVNGDLADIIIFREKSSSGRDVGFRATIDSAKKVITIVPRDDLDEDTKYYLAIDSKSIRTVKNGTRVPGASVTWTTGDEDDEDSDYVTFSPRDGKSNVDREVEPLIAFSERVEFYDGESIDSGRSSKLEECITFEDEDGDHVSFKAYYDTSNYEISIRPTDLLRRDTEYTISILRRSFQTRSDEEAIPAASFSFTTED